MYWSHYDKATGAIPQIGDNVETCHLGEGTVDGAIKGVFAGWSTQDKISGIVILDKPSETGELAISMPAVCLRLTV